MFGYKRIAELEKQVELLIVKVGGADTAQSIMHDTDNGLYSRVRLLEAKEDTPNFQLTAMRAVVKKLVEEVDELKKNLTFTDVDMQLFEKYHHTLGANEALKDILGRQNEKSTETV